MELRGGIMALTENGISTTRTNGQFAFEQYRSPFTGDFVQWDYRDQSGTLHSGVVRTLEQAKAAASRFGYNDPQ